jgi:hypothetical protein
MNNLIVKGFRAKKNRTSCESAVSNSTYI